ncbi:MAG: electron transport complex subunit RsxC [Bacteroidales bacterium]|nr:electron transport complex subunit RsxC [Bacteroidales bacterium]MDD3200372.1 electron transport complex subunit RsxC [Bacteroidales bacterium]
MKTFKIGGVHPNDNKLTADSLIEVFPVLETAYISMAQHLGAPAKPVVEKGDKVKVGQVIGEPAGFISGYVHSSVSGTVKAVELMPDLAGNPVMHVVIEVEGDEWCEEIDRTPDIKRDIPYSSEEIIEKIKNGGIVGLGGAAFPTHVKLNPPKDKKAEFLILNGSECEPYVTADDRIMRERPEEILIGAVIMMKALNVTQAFVGIEVNKPQAIAAMKKAAADYPQIKIVVLKKKYPQGGEKQLIDAITGRRVPSMGLPIDVGVVVQNVGTSLAVYEAVQKNQPLIESAVTVTGHCVTEQRNFLLRVGTPFSRILDAVGGLPKDAAKFISGGPMMGKAVANIDASTLKGTSAFLLMTEEETKRKQESNCIRCAKCVEACPMGLEPYLLNKLCRAGNKYDELEKEKIYDCIECGCCLYTCPANIPLLDIIRMGKADVMKIIRNRPKK